MGWREDLAAEGISYMNCGDAAELDEAADELRARRREALADDRYDVTHPEQEHDGGLGSGDWMGPWEDRR